MGRDRGSHSLGRKGWLVVGYATLLYFASSIIEAIVQIAVPVLVALRGWGSAPMAQDDANAALCTHMNSL